MKKIIILGIVGILNSCVSDKELLSPEDQKNWSVKNDTIIYNNVPLGVYDHFEYELNPSHGKGSKPIVELSIKQFSTNHEDLEKLIKFVHTKHSKQKVEIVVLKK